MSYASDSLPLWKPDPATVGATPMARFMAATGHGSYGGLWQWSVEQPETFWSTSPSSAIAALTASRSFLPTAASSGALPQAMNERHKDAASSRQTG